MGNEIMIDDWYSYGQFKFNEFQMQWAINNLALLKTGYWVPPPEGYGERVNHSTLKGEASFVKPEIIAAEVESRLEMTGRDGDLCMLHYHNGMAEYEIARLMNWDVWEVTRRIDRAMRYMSGWKRKKRTYQEFINHPKK